MCSLLKICDVDTVKPNWDADSKEAALFRPCDGKGQWRWTSSQEQGAWKKDRKTALPERRTWETVHVQRFATSNKASINQWLPLSAGP